MSASFDLWLKTRKVCSTARHGSLLLRINNRLSRGNLLLQSRHGINLVTTNVIQTDRTGGPSRVHWTEKSKLSHQDEQIQARRQSEVGASTSYDLPGETATDAAQYYKRLAVVAQQGEYTQAEQLLHEMVNAGFDLTPQAYHGLIFSCMKGGNSSAALQVLNAELESGVQPIAESYAVVIYSCIMNGDMEAAEDVYGSLIKAAVDRQPGWLCYVKGIVSQGLMEDPGDEKVAVMEQVESILDEGRQEGWFPDVDLYEQIFGLLCEDPKKALIAEQMLHDELVLRDGVQAETRHYNCILRAEAVWMGVNSARGTVREMIEGQKGRHIRPDIGTYNALLEGCLVERMQGFSYATEDLEGVIGEVVKVGIPMDKRTHTLLLMFYLLEYNVDRVLFELREIEKLSAPGKVLQQLSDGWMTDLLEFLLKEKCILEVLRLLCLLHADQRQLPTAAVQLDENQLSFHTRWLPTFLAGQHFGRRNAGCEKYQEEDREDAFMVEDTWINQKNIAIDEDSGAEMSVSNMTASQMKAELEAKGLETVGPKRDLTRRVQQSRGNRPRTVREEMQQQKVELKAKYQRDEERFSGRVEKKESVLMGRFVEEWDTMGPHRKRIETFVMDPHQAQREQDAKHFENLNAMDLSAEVKALLKEHRRAFNKKEAEQVYMLDNLLFDTEDPQFKALNPNFGGREGFGFRLTWPKWGRGARLAFYMLELSQLLGAGASISDFLEINEACIEEEDSETAMALLVKMHPYAGRMERNLVELFYSKTLMLCMKGGRMDFVQSISEAMEQLDLEPAGLLDQPGMLPGLRDAAEQVQKSGLTFGQRDVPEPLDEEFEELLARTEAHLQLSADDDFEDDVEDGFIALLQDTEENNFDQEDATGIVYQVSDKDAESPEQHDSD